jgi:hypothetical protein
LDLGGIFGIENPQFGSGRQSEGFQMDPDAPGVFRLQAGTPDPGAIGQGSPSGFATEYPDRIGQQTANAHTGSPLGILLKPRGIFSPHHGEVWRSESESNLRGQSLQGAHRQGFRSGRCDGGADPRWKFHCENREGQAQAGQPTHLRDPPFHQRIHNQTGPVEGVIPERTAWADMVDNISRRERCSLKITEFLTGSMVAIGSDP